MTTFSGLTSLDENEPKIQDAVIDQRNNRWLKYGTKESAAWFSITELQLREQEVFARMGERGFPLLTTRSKNDFKNLVEAHKSFRGGLVADRSGWTGEHFVFGDGTVISPPGYQDEVIVAFELRDKFQPAGTLEGWKEGMAAVKGQPVPLFALAYAFVPPLLRFAPDLMNPQIEFVGPAECGKTTIAMAAMSVWAGNPESEVGGGETWDMTALFLDREKEAHAGQLLFLDEGNLAGTDSNDQREVIRRVVFMMSSKKARRRLTMSKLPPVGDCALVSTGNVPLRDLAGINDATNVAMQSRMPTIHIDPSHRFGIFETVPDGFESSQRAADQIKRTARENYGIAARVFVTKLVEEAQDPAKFVGRVESLREKFASDIGPMLREKMPRVVNTFAITFAAGILARKWGLLPKEWGRFLPAFRGIVQKIPHTRGRVSRVDGGAEITKYLERFHDEIVDLAMLKKPIDERRFKQSPGFIRQGDRCFELLVPTERLKREIPDTVAVLADLKACKRLKSEGGKSPKSSIKAPRHLCRSGRVYCIRLDGTFKFGR